MIGGYIFRNENKEISQRLNDVLGKSYKQVSCSNSGFLFYDNPYPDFQTTVFQSNSITFLSHDLLVSRNSAGDYYELDHQKDLPELFLRRRTEVFNEIVSEYRLILIDNTNEDVYLYLVSNRAGNGRIYYCIIESGILFSSDIRFLQKIVPFQVSDIGIYAILKYGAIPEPLTISENISAVPAAHYLSFIVSKVICQTVPYFQFKFPCDQHSVLGNFDTLIQPAKDRLSKSAQFLSRYKPAILISGGIDSSLYASYLNEASDDPFHGINCIFGDEDPEFAYANELAEKINVNFHVGRMEKEDALDTLNDAVSLTGHPFSDFSSLPIVFILKFMKDHVGESSMLIEGNGGDDCFGFPDLTTHSKMMFKSIFPAKLKVILATLFKDSSSWKWETQSRFIARLLALSDVHEINPVNYFLALTPLNFLDLNTYKTWDHQLNKIMEGVFSNLVKDIDSLSYEANLTVRQLMHVNSRRWAAKAYSVGENLGIRVIYPYIWRDILLEQGNIPWQAKINKDIVKWPLKRLLEEFMPKEFIYRKKSGFVPPFKQWLTSANFNNLVRDTLLSSDSNITRIVPPTIIEDLLRDALDGKNLRHAILNFLWGGLFTEMWIRKQKSPSTQGNN